jgi:hypothetical protein
MGTGWATPNTPCPTCKGKGEALHQFMDVIKVIEFPDNTEYAELVVKENNAPSTSSN